MLHCFDGTWNDERNPDTWTNVHKLSRIADPSHSRYYRGVGNGADCRGWKRLAGGAFGLGFSRLVDRALREHARALAGGDRIVDVVGFSRGAVAALVFLNKLRDAERLSRSATCTLRFCGLFDAVDALGLPDIDWDFWYDKRLARGVEVAVHAIAVHETRRTFQCLDVQGAEQVGFAGAHCDVGGGYPQTGLADISLAWMIGRATAAGVPLPGPRSSLHLKPRPAMPPHRVDGAYGHAPRIFPTGMLWPEEARWPIMELVPPAKGARGGRGGRPVEREWRFLDPEWRTRD